MVRRQTLTAQVIVMEDAGANAEPLQLPAVELSRSWTWDELRRAPLASLLAGLLPKWLRSQRWFGGKGRTVVSAGLFAPVVLDARRCLALARVTYHGGRSEIYLLPLLFADSDTGVPLAIIRAPHGGVLCDAPDEPEFARKLLELIAGHRSIATPRGTLAGWSTDVLPMLLGEAGGGEVRQLEGEQSNTSISYGDRLILKLYRRVEQGVNPDLEMTTFLTRQARFQHVPPLAGAIELRGSTEPRTLGMLQQFVPNQGDAWRSTLQELDRICELVLAGPAASPDELIDASLRRLELLAQRTAQLHLALAQPTDDERFSAEPFTIEAQGRMAEEMMAAAGETFDLMSSHADSSASGNSGSSSHVHQCRELVTERFSALATRPLSALRLRCHGDYHLGQVLCAGDDFIIIDFEGEPARSLDARREKQSPLRDVAGMLRSLDYAQQVALRERRQSAAQPIAPLAHDRMFAALAEWHRRAQVAFVDRYRQAAAGSALLPRDPRELRFLLDIYLLEKAVYELRYELNNRPDWVHIPWRAIQRIVDL